MNVQRGSALFLILIAVALFAALSYAVTQTGRGSGNTKRENIQLAVSQALQQASSVKIGIQRVRIIEGGSENQITFIGPHYGASMNAAHANPYCTGTSCEVFHTNGGGVTYTPPPPLIAAGCLSGGCTAGSFLHNTWLFTGSAMVPGIGNDTTSDLLMATLVDQATCVAINSALGVTNPSGAPPQLAGANAVFSNGFDGDYPTATGGRILPAEVAGVDAACVNQQHPTYSSDFAWFYIILVAR